jgi:hypothetical protein
MSIENGSIDRDCDLWICVCAESVGHATEAARSRIKRAQIDGLHHHNRVRMARDARRMSLPFALDF